MYIVMCLYGWFNEDVDILELDEIPLGIFNTAEEALSAINEIYPIDRWRGGMWRISEDDYPEVIGEALYEGDCDILYRRGQIIELSVIPLPPIGTLRNIIALPFST